MPSPELLSLPDQREGFRALVKELGLLRTARRDDFILVWSEQVAKAYDWYAD